MTEIEEKIPFASWDQKQFLLNGKPFTPVIYEGDGAPPEGFNACVIRLRGRVEDDLYWQEELDSARNWIQKGYYILWELDFGFPKVAWEDEQAFQTLKIAAIEFSKHFPEFESASLGILLYKGSADLTESSSSQEKRLFCLDSLVHYFSMLAPYLPDVLPHLCALDGAEISTGDFLELVSKERFEHLMLAVKGEHLPYGALSWQKGGSPFGYLGSEAYKVNAKEVKTGVIFTKEKGLLENAIALLKENGIPFRILYEDFVVSEWDGLDQIIYLGEMNLKVKRILLGFAAAGGQAVCEDESLSGRVSMREYVEMNRGRGI
jgi:hypothetical protein